MRRIIVFLKYPEPGRVKTRLAAAVGIEAAARLARHFAEETLAAVRQLGLPVEICFAPAEREAEVRAWLGQSGTYAPQHGADLGERMRNAFIEAFRQGAERVVLVGTDAPDRPVEFLSEALARLADHDAVLGPALDGGYHLIAMRRAGFTPAAFAGIAWSTPRVLAQTIEALRRAGRLTHVLPPWRDIDDRAGLDAYMERHPRVAGLLRDDGTFVRGEPCRMKA
ncbi:MAG: TIGR04282 family arsenosugar biosynthesis glycosyltransferase [Humidesulfovibrio sp.]|nr:TIGR04282 family arsenosugar biosynthesis glycosyltransferase [Humidesulfovibrio sp.]